MPFWSDLYDRLQILINLVSKFTINDLTFCITIFDVHNQFLLNHIFYFSKFYIHKCKCLKTKQLFTFLSFTKNKGRGKLFPLIYQKTPINKLMLFSFFILLI